MLAYQPQRDLQDGRGRAELMRHVPEQQLLGGAQRFEPFCHPIKLVAKVREFIMAVGDPSANACF